MKWALVGLAVGGCVGGVAFAVQWRLVGRAHLQLPVWIAVTVALAVMAWANDRGVMKDPEDPPGLALDDRLAHKSDTADR